MIRVVHLVSTLQIGGLEKVVLDLARCADRDRFALHVLCLDDLGELAAQFDPLGVPVELLDCSRLRKTQAVLRVHQRLRELRPEVLHTHNPRPHILGVSAARMAGVPVVVHTKHGRNDPGRWRTVALNRIAAQFSDRVIAVSNDAAAVAREIEGVPMRKVQVIHNGIDLARFPSAPERVGNRRVVHVARLNPIKDQATLLRATRIVADAMPDMRLDIVGDGPSRTDLETLTDKLALRDQVRFLGFRSDVSELLSGADLFVLSSRSEGISLTLLEAMATGLPIVATEVGGNREVVVPGETGLLVPPQTPTAMAAAMRELLSQPGIARRMGNAGRRRAEDEFDLRRVVARYEELYLSLLHRKRRGISLVGSNR